MIEPNKELLADPEVARITLGGVQWPVPKLAIKQLKIIMPLLLPFMSAERSLNALMFTAKDIDDLATIAHAALSRGHAITREEVEDLAASPYDLLGMLLVVAQQTGMMKPAPAGGSPPGEATGTSPTGAG